MWLAFRSIYFEIGMMSHEELEEGSELSLDWDKLSAIGRMNLKVIPAVAQDVETGTVLIVGYVNAEALMEARRLGVAVFWSTSRNALWVKGATSGNTLKLEAIRINCEQNSILYRVHVSEGKGACHTANVDGSARFGCYYRKLNAEGLLELIEDRDAL